MEPEIVPIGELPPLGVVPRKMYAQVIREERFGEPAGAFAVEAVDVPEIGRDECLIAVMAAGINYNGCWAAYGAPVNVIRLHRKLGEGDFHIAGTDAAGIVYKVGADVTQFKVGDEVTSHPSWWESDCPHVLAGRDPMLSPTLRAWGYETNHGSFAQFARVKAAQLVPRCQHLTWEQSAAFMCNGVTAYRSLYAFPEHRVQADDVVLIWGGAGGLGSLAIQLCREAGAIPIAVVSDEAKFDHCLALGARGVINRTKFDHWGVMPHWDDGPAYRRWLDGAKAFGAAIWEAVGAKRNPRIVFEHSGEATVPTSCFVCDAGGMIVICAGTSGYNATFDLRYHWMRQKRFQGTHGGNSEQAHAINELIRARRIDPTLSRTLSFEEIPLGHQLMHERRHPNGNMAALVGAKEPGTGARD